MALTPQNEIVERINGFAVIAAFQLQGDNGVREAVVVCDRNYQVPADEAYENDRYVVWTLDTLSGNAFWGFYTDSRSAALDKALARAGWTGLKGYRKPKAA